MPIVVLVSNGSTDQTQQIRYEGYTLPRDAKKPTPIPLDATNNPKLLITNAGTPQSITLPEDTVIHCPGEKQLVETRILDGVSVTERINRDPYQIEFEFTLRATDASGTTFTGGAFPQKLLESVWNNLWLPDTVVKVQNTYLNGLGVSEIIIKKIKPTTVRGSTNIHVEISAIENVPGQMLDVSP